MQDRDRAIEQFLVSVERQAFRMAVIATGSRVMAYPGNPWMPKAKRCSNPTRKNGRSLHLGIGIGYSATPGVGAGCLVKSGNRRRKSSSAGRRWAPNNRSGPKIVLKFLKNYRLRNRSGCGKRDESFAICRTNVGST